MQRWLWLWLCVWLFSPVPAQAVTYWDDPFAAAQNCNWLNGASCLEVGSGVIQLDASVFFAGNGSVKYVYDYPTTGSCLPGNANFVTDCGGGWFRSVTNTETLWRRFWIRLSSSFVVGSPQTKLTQAKSDNMADWLIMLAGTTQLTMANQGFPDAGTTNLLYTSGFLRRGVWECVEIGQVMNTPGVANGTLQMYLNDAQIYNSSTIGWRRTGDNKRFNSIQLYRQYGSGTINIDNYAAGNTRIGCGSAPPPPSDTTAPTTPTNVTASATVPLQNSISWTASTDAGSGVQDYTITFCTGAACTPATTLTTTSTTGVTHTGLTGGTVYGYQVTARDVAGNTSAASTVSYVTALSSPAANALSITSNGLFAINGVSTFLLGISYMDGLNYRTSDIDTLATKGFNNLRVFVNYSEDTYAGARAVCTADGSLNTTRRDTIQALIDYAQTKTMTVTLIIMSEQTDALIPVEANRQTCVTNIINAYKAEPLVMFDLNNEHTEAGNTWMDTTTEYGTYHALAKAACAACIIFASSTSPYSHPQDLTATLVTSYFDGMLVAGVNVLAFHDYRGSNWYSISGARVTALRNYLASKNRSDIPVYFSEPCRQGYAAECNTSASTYFQAAADAKAAGAAGWVLHHGYFDFSVTALMAQLGATENTVVNGLSAALSGGSSGSPVSLATYDFAGTFASNFTGGYTSHETPVQTGGRMRAFSTSGESLAEYVGATEPANHGATIQIATANGTAPQYGRVEVGLRAAPDYSGYGCRFSTNPSAVSIVRKDAGNPVTLTSSSAVSVAAGDTFGCFKNGSSVYMTKGSVTSTPILSVTDTTYLTGGGAALYMGTAGSPLADWEFDNFTLYEYGTPAAACTPSMLTASVTASGATVTWDPACTPTQIRVTWGANDGSYSSASLEPIANFPSGVFTKQWDPRTQFACFAALDAQGVENTAAGQPVCGSVTIPVDTAVIVMSNGKPSATLPQGTTSTVMSIDRDKDGGCRYHTSDVAYSSMTGLMTSISSTLTSSVTLTGLTNGSSTTYYVRCNFTDILGVDHPNTTSATITVAVAAVTADTTAPSTIAGVVAAALSESQIQVSWGAGTDNVLLSKYHVYGCATSGCSTYVLMGSVDSPALTTILQNLLPNTPYTLVVKAEDSSGNFSAAYSNTATVSTPDPLDTTAPSDPVGLTVIGTYANAATISWTPGTDNKSAVRTSIEICSGSLACTAFGQIKTVDGTTYTIPNLTASTAYRVRIIHIDDAGNVSANYSSRVGFTTAAAGLPTPRLEVPYSTPRLSSGTRLPR